MVSGVQAPLLVCAPIRMIFFLSRRPKGPLSLGGPKGVCIKNIKSIVNYIKNGNKTQ